MTKSTNSKIVVMKKAVFIFLILWSQTQIFGQKKLPVISLKDIEGKTVDISDINTDKVVVFSFWATWCVPCINELDAINEVYADWQKETGVELIAISVDDMRSAAKVKPLVNGKGWKYLVLFDTNQEFKQAVHAHSIPYLLVVKNKKIVYTHTGYIPGSESDLYKKIKEYSF
jgi:peroxiredoxin